MCSNVQFYNTKIRLDMILWPTIMQHIIFSFKERRDKWKKSSSSGGIFYSFSESDYSDEESDTDQKHQKNQKVVEMKFAGNR